MRGVVPNIHRSLRFRKSFLPINRNIQIPGVDMIAVQVFCLLSLLLVVGKVLRVGIPLLQKLYLPSSVIGGLAGLIVSERKTVFLSTVISSSRT